MNNILKGLLGIFLIFTLSCSNDTDKGTSNDKGKSKFSKIQSQNLITLGQNLYSLNSHSDSYFFSVIDENNEPIPEVLVQLNNENLGQSLVSENGVFELSQRSMDQITLSAPGYVTTTYSNVHFSGQIFKLQSQKWTTQAVKIEGNTSGFGRLVRDKKFDFSIVLPAFKRSNLVQFDASNILSPEIDRVKVPTRTVAIPSNLTLPNQSERYLFFTIKFNKPQYKLFVSEPGDYQIFASHGQFPMNEIMDAFQNGQSMFSMLNHFTFKQGGVRQVSAPSNVSGQDISVNEIQYNQEVLVKGPKIDSSQVMISAFFMNKEENLLPSDIKLFKSLEQRKLKTAPQFSDKAYLLSILKQDDLKNQNPSFRELSMAIQTKNELNDSPYFLNHIPVPEIATDKNELNLGLPLLPKKLTEFATVIYYSEIEKVKYDEVESEKRKVLHQMVLPGWQKNIDISAIQYNAKPGFTYRWEAVVMAIPIDATTSFDELYQQDFSSVTHATFNAADVQEQTH